MNLLEVRKLYNLSQKRASDILSVPLRTYIRYETDNSYGNSFKREMMIKTIVDSCEITETKGLLSIDRIKDIITTIIDYKYNDKISLVYLFGSYAKGYAKETSDVDLCISTDITGIDFLGLVEDLRNGLHKKADVVRLCDIKQGNQLLIDIMKNGIKVYG